MAITGVKGVVGVDFKMYNSPCSTTAKASSEQGARRGDWHPPVLDLWARERVSNLVEVGKKLANPLILRFSIISF